MDWRRCKTWFQVIEMHHLSVASLPRFPPLLFNTIGNIRQGFHNLPRTTPGLKEFLPPCPSSVSILDSVSYMRPLTMASGVVVSFLSFLCPLEALSHSVLCFLQLLLLLNNIIRITLPPSLGDVSSFRTASRGKIASSPNITRQGVNPVDSCTLVLYARTAFGSKSAQSRRWSEINLQKHFDQ